MPAQNAQEKKIDGVDLENIVTSEESERINQPIKGDISVEEPFEKSHTTVNDGSNDTDFQELKDSSKGGKTVRDIEFLLDIPLEVSVEVGRTKLLINDLLQLGQGSVIELNKLAGEPMEILINQKLIARGEVVVVNEKFGIRLTDIISPMERVQKLA